MYLKEIRTHGFKSFADKINIEMNNGITCIVGPNGSGKSNVVDAVRWVLGEQSIKSLRGDGNMSDVIFSGSKSRNMMNIASVTLIFDNSDNYLKLPNTEVSIKRRVYRDGTNEYYINGEKCRLKDITDILLDSGVAKESFNIISQGKIEEILNSKPIDRRVIFEEAAGVLKYKRRKEDALRKLDKTNDNLSRINDIIGELKIQVEPLEIQKNKALEYIEVSKELENIEISLLANDITNISYKYKQNKEKQEQLNKEILALSTNNNGSEARLEKYKLDINKLDNELSSLNKCLMDIVTKISKLNAEKQIITERQNYNVDDTKVHNAIIELNEKKLSLENEISRLNGEIDTLESDNTKKSNDYNEINQKLNDIKVQKTKTDDLLSNTLRNNNYLNLKIDSLNTSIQENSLLPYAVRQVLSNPKLLGIHGALGNLIDAPEKYARAITSSLGAAFSNVVVDNEACAKETINYLKNNNIGRVTFYPLNIMKEKNVDEETLRFISNMGGFIGVASTLINFDTKYSNVIKNQLGNVLVTNNIDSANAISKKINYRYKIVTLDGEVLNVGGSITGGNLKQNRNIISDKYELERLLKEKDEGIIKVKTLEEKINEIDKTYKAIEDELYLINRDRINNEEVLKNKRQQINNLNLDLNTINKNIMGMNNMLNNKLNEEEEKVINDYYSALKEKDELELKISNITKEKQTLSDALEEYEHEIRKENSIFNSKNKELKDLEIAINRADVKLDTLLTTLNEEYNMTYEKAVSNYKLEIEENMARGMVSKLKAKIKEIGPVNINAPEEYAKVSERYEFLNRQKDDLISAENTLMDIINELDDVMKKEFSENFEIIRKNFTQTFKELFKGGTADLKLLDPDNILESGIDIVASPPGKKLTTISLLSGGEKTFTAISLVFAILKSRCVPFCIFDEVEAALDEANVDSFGKYLKTLTSKTQFILITHKKKTMEYADILYGITMQESGVSKLVSVKLEDMK